ncbi:hypothetical protein AAKU55_001232 [Oxalobacteraceae bacterium GrIS 1.11]
MPPYQIIRIPILPFGMVNAHLIVGPRGCVLVDAAESVKLFETIFADSLGSNFDFFVLL